MTQQAVRAYTAKEIPTESAVNTRVILCPHSLPVISIVIASMLAIPTNFTGFASNWLYL